MARTLVDPRTHPTPADPRPSPQTTEDPAALLALHRLCRDGRLYDVEQWIRDGRSLQLAAGVPTTGHRAPTALGIALETPNQALVLLLLCNGYDPNLESACPVSVAIRARQWALMELLLAWGADPQRVAPEDVCESYSTELLERFHGLGVDFTADHVLGHMLAEHSSNKPLFGFAKRHCADDPKIQRDLTMALGHHAGSEGSEKGVLLCLWAGADPHARVPSLQFPSDPDEDDDAGSTAIEEACRAGNLRILEKLKPDPARDDFDELYASVPDSPLVDVLARSAPPANLGKILCRQLFWLEDRPYFESTRSAHTLWRIFAAGGRWETSPPAEIADIRRALLRLSDVKFVEVLRLLASGDHCSPAILHELGRTPSMRTRMKLTGLVPSPYDAGRRRPTRSREVLVRFGVTLPGATASGGARAESGRGDGPRPILPPCVEIGFRRRSTRELRLDRTALFERVWSEPVEKLAMTWGMSGRGLAKACQRLKIPVPPRGFWTKVLRGQSMRRPMLPALGPTEAKEIVIHVLASSPDPEQEAEQITINPSASVSDAGPGDRVVPHSLVPR